MPRKRDLREDERALWEAATRDVKQHRGGGPKPFKAVEAKQKLAVTPLPAPAKPRRSSAPAFGIDGATAERLRRGKVEPDATIDLHGLTQAQAHARLVAFVRRGSENGYRCLLVVTGKGALARDDGDAHGFVMPDRSKAGVLRAMVPRWLEELRTIVVGAQSAHRRHGGTGALYVYLRRKRGRD